MNLEDYLMKIPGLKRLISTLGIDKAIFFTVLNFLFLSLAGIISIFFIVNYLTISEQGYWYTFLSLGALTTFAELGFTTIITQFISHEYAHLKEKEGKLCGDKHRMSRLVSLIRFSFKFYITITSGAFIILSIIGLIVLMASTKNSYILFAWLIYSFTGALILLGALVAAVLKGLDKVEVVQKIMTIVSVLSNIVIWVSLYKGLSLWALIVGGFINIILSMSMFYLSSPLIWKQIFIYSVTEKYHWLKETLPLQWRYAISWVSGYFIFQFMVPVALIYAGADVAGKLGLSLVIARAVQSIANSWGMTKIPKLNILVAQKNRFDLDKLLKITQKQSLIAFIIGSFLITLILLYIFPLINWEYRILPTYEIIIILIGEGANLIVFNWAYYLRSHKEEPYMRISVISALGTGLGVFFSFYIFSSTLIALCTYSTVALIMLFPAWRIFVKKRIEYDKKWG